MSSRAQNYLQSITLCFLGVSLVFFGGKKPDDLQNNEGAGDQPLFVKSEKNSSDFVAFGLPYLRQVARIARALSGEILSCLVRTSKEGK